MLGQLGQLLRGHTQSGRRVLPDLRNDLIVQVGDDALHLFFDSGHHVLKAIVDPDDLIPNNEGIYAAIAIQIPEGSLLRPRQPAVMRKKIIAR